MSTDNPIPPLEERIQARHAAAKDMASSSSQDTAKTSTSTSQGTVNLVPLLHLWTNRVTNAKTGEVVFTISRAPNQPRYSFRRPLLVVNDAAIGEQICTVRTGKLRASSIRVTLPDQKKIKMFNASRKWAFTPTITTTTTTTTDPNAKRSNSPLWIWQRDSTGVLPSVILIGNTGNQKDGKQQPLARISANLLSFPSLDSVTAKTWTEIVITAIGLAQHVRNWCKYGGTLEGSGGIVMGVDSCCGGDGGGGGGDGGGCGGDGGGGGGGGGGGDGGS